MSDPFEALREPIEPTTPDPLFAAHLRARLKLALALPKGVTVSNLTLAAGQSPVIGATSIMIPYLAVADARRALTWYADALGARAHDPHVMADGRIGHAELSVGGATFYLADESPASHFAAPDPGADVSVSLLLTVPDVDRLVEQTVEAGAQLERPAADYPYGRNAVIRDPFGHRWILSAPAPSATPARHSAASAPREGDAGYVSLWVPDAERAAAFFGGVLGWTFRPGSAGRSWQVEGTSLPSHGISGGQPGSTLFLCFVVNDMAAALARVRAAGGEEGVPRPEAYGSAADCVDNQGVPFALVELPAGAAAPRAAMNGERHGDIAYLTMAVEDSAKARSFYGAVLGWRFRPGRAEDGWEADEIVPMLGLQGGHGENTIVPMYRVDDIHGAVGRVRALGGTAPDPEQQSYGITVECVDDQGTRFYLGQL